MSTFNDGVTDFIENLLVARLESKEGQLIIDCESHAQAKAIKIKIYQHAKKVREKAIADNNYNRLYQACNSFSLDLIGENKDTVLIKSRNNLMTHRVLQKAMQKVEEKSVEIVEPNKLIDDLKTVKDQNKNKFYERK